MEAAPGTVGLMEGEPRALQMVSTHAHQSKFRAPQLVGPFTFTFQSLFVLGNITDVTKK